MLGDMLDNSQAIGRHRVNTDYETDFYAWATEQTSLLRGGRFSQLDVEPVAEDIETLGKRKRQVLISRPGVLLAHLLKWRYQPDSPYRKSGKATINAQRRAIARLLDDNPSLHACLPESISVAFADGLDHAVSETPLDCAGLPADRPWNADEILGKRLPDAPSGNQA